MIYDPFNSENAKYIYDPSDPENEVFGIHISVQKVHEDFVAFRREKKWVIALVEFEFAGSTLRFGFHRPVITRAHVSPLIINPNNEYESDDPKKMSLMISSKLGIPADYATSVFMVGKKMAGNAIDRFNSDRAAKKLFGGGPVAFRNPGRDLDADPADADQP